MAKFEVEHGGKRYQVEAPTMEDALAGLDQQYGSSQPAAAPRPGGMEIVNEGIARGLGAPVDLATGGINALISGVNTVTGSDFGHIADPVGGSSSIRNAFQGTGNAIAGATGRDTETQPVDMFAGEDYQPDGVVENLLMGTGSAAGGVLPMVGVGKALQTASAPIATAIGDTLAQPYAQAPIRAVASELAAGGGAGVGIDVADQLAPDSALAQVIGALTGGAVAGAGPYLAGQTVQRLPVVSTVGKMVQNEIVPFTEAGAMERARRRMAGLVEDPEAAIANLKSPTIGSLSPAVSTGERRMMSLENVVRDGDAGIDLRMRQAEAEGNASLRAALVEPGQGIDGQAGRVYMEGAIGQQVDGVGQALDDTFGAPKPIASAMSDLRTSTAPARRTAYDAAYETPIDYASDPGRELGGLLSRVERAAPGAIRLANRLMAGEGVESQQIMAEIADDGLVTFLTMPDTRQVDYIKRALDQMGQSGDGAGALGGQTDVGRVMSGLSRQIRDSLKAANPMYGPALETAAAPIAQRRALAFGQDLLKPSVARDMAASQIADMTGPEVQAVRDAVRAQLDEQLANVRMSISNPDVGMRQAQQALVKLSAPAVREKISMLFPDEQASALFQKMDSATAMLDPRRSGPAVYASARPDEEVRSIMNSPNPRAAAEQLMQQASADPTGQALPSLKGNFIGELMSRAKTGSFDEASEAVLSGRAMQNALNDSRVAPVASTILSMEERARLGQIIDELAKVEAARGRLPNVGGIMEGEPNSMISLLARTFAARVGAHAGKGASGASLLTASWASKRMQGLLQNLTTDRAEGLIKQAITGDRELFEALLTPGERWTPKQESRIYNVLSATLQGTAAAAAGQAGLGSDEAPPAEEEESTGDPIIDLVMRGGKRPALGQSLGEMEFEQYLQNMFAQPRRAPAGPDYGKLDEYMRDFM